MIYEVLADSVVLIHFLWILFLFSGGLFRRKNRFLRVFHLLGLLFAMVIQTFNWVCPLTHLEVWLRTKHDAHLIYTGDFIIHYVERIVYVEVSRGLIFVCTTFLLGFNLWIYLKKE